MSSRIVWINPAVVEKLVPLMTLGHYRLRAAKDIRARRDPVLKATAGVPSVEFDRLLDEG